MGWGLPEISKNEILRALSIAAKRGEWAGGDVSEPRSVPGPSDLELVNKRSSWVEVPVHLRKDLKLQLILSLSPAQVPKQMDGTSCGPRTIYNAYVCMQPGFATPENLVR